MLTDDFKERYLNLYTDFGFKTLFGTPMNKDLLISFLNALLHEEQHIVDVTYLNTEQLGMFKPGRKALLDVYCENDRGEKFIVEMQKAARRFFKDRSAFYSSFPICEQAQRSDWNFELEAVYTIGILNFVFDEYAGDEECYHHEVKLMDVRSKRVFFDKLNFIYLEMPKFRKTADELVTMFDKWMFVLRNLSNLLERPAALQERIFEKLFRTAEIARFTPRQADEYEESLKVYRALNNVIDTAAWQGEQRGLEQGLEQGRAEGRAEGIAEGRAEGIAEGRAEGIAEERLRNARNLKALGIAPEVIARATGLTEEEVRDL